MYQELMTLHIPVPDEKSRPGAATPERHKSISPSKKADTHIVPLPRRRVNRLLAMLIGAAITAPYALALAYAERGYLAVGGEVFLIALGAAVGGWLADHWGGGVSHGHDHN